MKNAVDIVIISQQQQGNDSDKCRLKTTGTLENTDTGYLLTYTEPDAEMGNSISRIYLYGSHKAELCRTGIYETRFLIEEGKTHKTLYKTPFGEMDMEITAQKVRTDVSMNGGRIHLVYTLESNSQLIGENTLLLDIRKI